MTHPFPALHLLEIRLRQAARGYASLLLQGEPPVPGAPARFLLARLAPELSEAEAADPTRLAPARRRAVAERLRLENRRLARFARAADPRYDLNRHIALARLLRQFEAPAARRGRAPRARRPQATA